jgi:hypothetical protein
VAGISFIEVDAWLRALPVSATTRNNFRRVLAVAFNFAKDRGYWTANHAEHCAQAKEIGGEIGILTIAETARLMRRPAPKRSPTGS